MEGEDEMLDSLVASHEQYVKHLPGLMRLLAQSRNRLQTLKDVLLYCKNCMSTSSQPIAKLLAMHLVRDLTEEQGEDVMQLVEQILLKKIYEVCLNQRRNSTIDLRDAEQKVCLDDYLRICLEAVLVWGKANEHNRKSKFYEVFQQLKEKQVKFPSELRYFSQSTKASRQEADLSKGTVQPNNSSDTIFTLVERYDEIRLYTKEELSKALKNPNYKVDVYKITHKLTKFYDVFRLKFARLSSDSDAYGRFNELNETVKELTKRLKHDGLDYRQTVRLIERALFEEEEEYTDQPDEELSQTEQDYVAPRHFDIFTILQNIHQRIEAEEKKAGLAGTY